MEWLLEGIIMDRVCAGNTAKGNQISLSDFGFPGKKNPNLDRLEVLDWCSLKNKGILNFTQTQKMARNRSSPQFIASRIGYLKSNISIPSALTASCIQIALPTHLDGCLFGKGQKDHSNLPDGQGSGRKGRFMG